MLSIIITILSSIVIILIGHHLWDYMKDNYSVKKTNYLVGSQIEKYKSIMKDLQVFSERGSSETLDLKADLEDYLSTINNQPTY
jgi:uncharacterized protein YxeA